MNTQNAFVRARERERLLLGVVVVIIIIIISRLLSINFHEQASWCVYVFISNSTNSTLTCAKNILGER